MRRAALLAALVAAPLCHGDVFDTFGFGPRGAAMGGALTADVNDYSAVFYNPARLVLAKDVNFGFAFGWNRAATSVVQNDLAKDLDCTYCQPPDAVGFSTGLIFPLGGKVKNRVAIGVGIYLPSQVLLRTQAPDPNRPFWYLFNSNPERIVLYTGLGIRLTDSLTIGVGLQNLADLIGQGASIRVDLFSKQVRFREIDSHLATRSGPVAGINFMPADNFRIGFTFRAEMELLYQIPASIDLSGVGTLAFTVQGVTHYSPHTFNLGFAWDLSPDFTATLDLEYAMWSRAPSPYLSLTVDVGGDTLKALGLDSALDMQSNDTSPGLQDTFGPRLGLEYRVSDRFALRGGAFYRPTPVPLQNAPATNILDASAIGLAGGLGFSFDDPLEIFAAPVHIDLAGQMQYLLPREAHKDDTDTVPSYKYQATILGVSAAIRYDF